MDYSHPFYGHLSISGFSLHETFETIFKKYSLEE